MAEAGAEELDELADNALLAQHLCDDQHQVSSGGPFGQLADQPEADDFGHEHSDRLAEHDRLGLNAANAPPHDAQAIDHCRVRVGAHQAIREGDDFAADLLGEHGFRQVFQVHLVHDACSRRHGPEVREYLLAPADEFIALAVALELELCVDAQRVRRAKSIYLHRVVNYEINRDRRVDARRIAAHALHRRAQRGQINQGWHASEVLQHHARWLEGNLLGILRRRRPTGEPHHVVVSDLKAVVAAQRGLQQHLDRKG